jgi:hypothetical protein
VPGGALLADEREGRVGRRVGRAELVGQLEQQQIVPRPVEAGGRVTPPRVSP